MVLPIALFGGFLTWGNHELERQARIALSKNGVVFQNVGQVQSVTTDWGLSWELEGFDEMAYDVVGAKGSCKAVANFVDEYDLAGSESQTITYGFIIKNNGTKQNIKSRRPIDDDVSPVMTMISLSEQHSAIASKNNAEHDRKAGEAIARHQMVRQHLGSVTGTERDNDASDQLPGRTDFAYHVTGAGSKGTVYARFAPLNPKEKSVAYGFLDTGGKRYNLNDGAEMGMRWSPSMAMDYSQLTAMTPPDFSKSPAMQDYYKARDRRREVVGLLPGERETMTEEEIQKYESKEEPK